MSARRPTFALVIAVGVLLGALGTAVTTSVVEAQQVGVDQLSFCRDANGDRLRGDIDILLLLDDTATLSGPQGQDPRNSRFGVIRSFLEGVTQIPTAQRVNFATYTFGKEVTPILDFEAITNSDLDRIDQVIRDNNPAQQMKTNFIIAMNRASQALNARPPQNCRILLWFTDGNHDASDIFNSEQDLRESRELREVFCAPDGIADRVRAQRINTFVLLLRPPPSQPLRLEASKDVFQVLTGDREPGFPDEDQAGRRPTEDCDRPLGEQLGKVFAVDDAEKLVAIIADFLNEIEDGERITADPCPYPDGAVNSLALPDAHLIDWISVTDFSIGSEGPSPDASMLSVRSADGDEYAGDEVLERFREGGPSARFRIRSEFLDQLGAGWVVQAEQAEDLCLRSRAVDLTFSLSSAEPGLAVIAPEGLPGRLWADDRLSYFTPDGRQLTTAEALRSPEVRGRLRVDSVAALSSDGTLPARIVIDGAPVRSDECSVIAIPAALTVGGGLFAGPPEAPQAPLVSSECMLTPATRGEDGGTLDFTATLAGLTALRGDDQCDVGDDWHVLIDGQRITGTTQQLTVGGDSVRFAIASGAEPANEARDCIARQLPPVEFVWEGQTILVPASVTAEWVRRGDVAVASAFTVVALVFALLLSYGLLWFLNWWLLRPPAGATLLGFDVAGSLTVDQRGAANVEWSEGRPRSFTGILESGTGGGANALRVGHNSFSRVLPFYPWREPTLRMQRKQSAVTATSSPRVGSGIPIDFHELAVLSTRSNVPAATDRPIDVTFTVIVPKVRTTSLEETFARLEGRKSEMARRLQQDLLSRQPTDGFARRGRAGTGAPLRGQPDTLSARPRPKEDARKDGPVARKRPEGEMRPRGPQRSGRDATGIDSSPGDSGRGSGLDRQPPRDDPGEGNTSGGRRARPRPDRP